MNSTLSPISSPTEARRAASDRRNMTLKQVAILSVLFVLSLATHTIAIAQDLVSHARDLYVAADYENALNVLDAIEADARTADERQAVREYRALCLIALTRTADAIDTIRQMIDDDPFYRPAAGRRPPRFITLFDEVRRQRLIQLGRMRYAEATIAFDEHRNADASEAFALVLRLVAEAEADSRGEQRDEELNRLERFATRFLELVQARNQQTQVRERDTFDSTDANVAPPVSIRQEIPIWPAPTSVSTPFMGELEVVIDATGNVREVRLTRPIHPAYDPLVLGSASKWKYRPAIKNGKPVPYRKVITISLMTQRRWPDSQ